MGDVLRLEGEDQVPADILLVGSSDEFLRCQITTANLDGETNLKVSLNNSPISVLMTVGYFKNVKKS